MLDMLHSIRPILDRHARALRPIMLHPRIHAMRNVPLLRGVKHCTRGISQHRDLLARHWDGSLRVRPIVPCTIWPCRVKLIGKFHVDTMGWEPCDGEWGVDAAARDGFCDVRTSTRAGALLRGDNGDFDRTPADVDYAP